MKSTDTLPKAQPEMAYSGLHISYFLQKGKKSKSYEMDLPLFKNDITSSEPTVKMLDK
jgi:hypothetical protein